MRLRAKVDGNHAEVVKALRQIGCSVQSLAQLGNGVPDLLVARNGVMWLMEVKDGAKPPSGRKLTPDELAWAGCWKAPVYVVCSADDALRVIETPIPTLPKELYENAGDALKVIKP